MTDTAISTPSNPEQKHTFGGMCCKTTLAAVELLRNGKIGDELTRKQIEEEIGRPCGPQDGKGYANLLSAVKIVERDYKVVWAWVAAKQSWCYLSNDQRLDKAQKTRRVAQRRNKSALVTLAAVDTASLNKDDKRRYELQLAQASMVHLVGGTGMNKRLRVTHAEKGKLPEPKLDDIAGLFKD